MTKLNRAQRVALARVFKRAPILVREPAATCVGPRAMTYREFRKRVVGGFDGVAMVHWMGMWLGIEKDGYVHS